MTTNTYANVPTAELRARADAMGVQYPVWQAMTAELDRRAAAATTPARTVLEVRDAIAVVQKMLDTCDAFQHDLRNEPARDHDWVVGLPQYHRYLDRKRQLTKVTAAAIYACKYTALAAGAGVCNRVGEHVEPILYREALEAALQGQLKLHTFLCGAFQDLHAELVEAQAYERHLDVCAEQAAAEDAMWAADIAAYHEKLDAQAEAERVLADYRLDQRL